MNADPGPGTVKVIVVPADMSQPMRVIDAPRGVDTWQRLVGGEFEEVYFADAVAGLHAEGLYRLPENFRMGAVLAKHGLDNGGYLYRGDGYVAGLSGAAYCDVPDTIIEQFRSVATAWHQPFLDIAGDDR